ncbi:MAG TPA: response regulator transcription factor [Candidatus Hydrogenedentes bacterium]|nr:response regulator transcription factor [Candidatus Hydrogenedentota bacterium]HPG69695.1 response regulator transcription factor [Candidatus Hydrogenedentota bacterium]
MTSESTGGAGGIRVVIVDDHPAVRHGLALLLKSKGIVVCGEAGGRAEALALVEEHQPDVVLVDLSLGDEDGSVLLEDLHRRNRPALAYSMYEDGRRVAGAFAAGARGYVTKSEAHRVLVQAIAEVARGKRFVSPKAALALASHAASAPVESALSQLSAQEQQVYRLLEEGKATRDIAAVMTISIRTVESYCERICAKLGLDGMRELRHFASSHFNNGS